MPILPSVIEKILSEETSANQPVSQALIQKIGKDINALIDIVSAYDSFTTPGPHSWTCPDNVTSALLFGCGGGGGGAGGNNDSISGGGGNGAIPFFTFVENLVPGDIYSITIGAGGVGSSGALVPTGASGISYVSKGGDGGNTTFASTITYPGAKGGLGGAVTTPLSTRWGGGSNFMFENQSGLFTMAGHPQNSLALNHFLTGTTPSISLTNTASGFITMHQNTVGIGTIGLTTGFAGAYPAQRSPYAIGGTNGTTVFAPSSFGITFYPGGSGGGAGFGPGGNGANGVLPPTAAINGQSALATSYGAGGGGGGAGQGISTGGNGAGGCLFIFY